MTTDDPSEPATMPTEDPSGYRRVCTYLTPELSDRVTETASGEGLTVSAFLRQLIITELRNR